MSEETTWDTELARCPTLVLVMIQVSYLPEVSHVPGEELQFFLPQIAGQLQRLVRENHLQVQRSQEMAKVPEKAAAGRCPGLLDNA